VTPPERWESRPEPASPWIDALRAEIADKADTIVALYARIEGLRLCLHAEIATVSDQAKRIEALEAALLTTQESGQ